MFLCTILNILVVLAVFLVKPILILIIFVMLLLLVFLVLILVVLILLLFFLVILLLLLILVLTNKKSSDWKEENKHQLFKHLYQLYSQSPNIFSIILPIFTFFQYLLVFSYFFFQILLFHIYLSPTYHFPFSYPILSFYFLFARYRNILDGRAMMISENS